MHIRTYSLRSIDPSKVAAREGSAISGIVVVVVFPYPVPIQKDGT